MRVVFCLRCRVPEQCLYRGRTGKLPVFRRAYPPVPKAIPDIWLKPFLPDGGGRWRWGILKIICSGYMEFLILAHKNVHNKWTSLSWLLKMSHWICKALSTRTNRMCKRTRNVMQTWWKHFVWTCECRGTSITRNVRSTIRQKSNFVGFLADTKGIHDDIWTTVSTVCQCGWAKLFWQTISDSKYRFFFSINIYRYFDQKYR